MNLWKNYKDILFNTIPDIKKNYDKQSNILYGAARMWVDEIINPKDTRLILIKSLEVISFSNKPKKANYGVFQV